MPVLFIGHGSPENALGDNAYARSWKRLGTSLPKPALILCISAHWVTNGTSITAMESPQTIHDFYGFQRSLYKVRYPAPGSPEMATTIAHMIKSAGVGLDRDWGLDHGAWSVIRNMYPKADIPVLQLSLDASLAPKQHYGIGRELASLRKNRVLIIGSGNIVHNLGMADLSAKPYPFALEFRDFAKARLQKGDVASLVDYQKNRVSRAAHPTSEHYLPLLYSIAAAEGEPPKFFNDSFFAGSVGMLSVAFGMKRGGPEVST